MSDDARMTVPMEGGKHRRSDEPDVGTAEAPVAPATAVAVDPVAVDPVAVDPDAGPAAAVSTEKPKRKQLTFWQ